MSSQLDVKELTSKQDATLGSSTHAKPEMLEELAKMADRLQTKRDKLRGQLEEVQRQLDGINSTYGLFSKKRLVPSTAETPINLQGKTQLDALVSLAEANNNRLIVKKARRILMRTGLIKNAKNASSIIFTAINRSGRFERESPGIYKLIEQKRQPESQPTVNGHEKSNSEKPRAAILVGRTG